MRLALFGVTHLFSAIDSRRCVTQKTANASYSYYTGIHTFCRRQVLEQPGSILQIAAPLPQLVPQLREGELERATSRTAVQPFSRRHHFLLPIKFQRHLNFTRRSTHARDLAEASTVHLIVRTTEVGMVKSIEKLRSVFQSHPLAEPSQRNFLKQ